MREWVDVALLSSFKHHDGAFVVTPIKSFPHLLIVGQHVALVPPLMDLPRRVRVSSVVQRNENSVLVQFSETNHLSSACKLVGCHCLIKRDSLPDETRCGAYSIDTFLGWAVHDSLNGIIGYVSDIYIRKTQPLLVVKLMSTGVEVMIPFVEDICKNFDDENQCIDVFLPKGLLEL